MAKKRKSVILGELERIAALAAKAMLTLRPPGRKGKMLKLPYPWSIGKLGFFVSPFAVVINYLRLARKGHGRSA